MSYKFYKFSKITATTDFSFFAIFAAKLRTMMNLEISHSVGKRSRKLWVSSRDYFFIILGTLIYSVSFCGFILPNKVVIGGVTSHS